jgi:thymidylate kinase
MDRFWWSTLIYGTEQGVFRGSLELMIELERRHWGELSPNVVFLVTRRRPFRDELSQTRFERLANEYRGLAAANPSTVLIENSGSVAAALQTISQYTVSPTFTSE